MKYYMVMLVTIILLMLVGFEYQLDIMSNKDVFISELKQNISQQKNTISLLENHYTKPTHYLFSSPVHPDDYLRITSPFGYRQLINPFTGGQKESIHKGVDYLGTHKARIIAIASGKVMVHYPPPDSFYKGHILLGGMIKIDHGHGWTSIYGHLSSTYVKEGQFVERGAVIGRQGNTGLSYGDHLHMELRYNDKPVQPLKFIDIPQ